MSGAGERKGRSSPHAVASSKKTKRRFMNGTLATGLWQVKAVHLPFVNYHDRVFGHYFLGANVDMRVGERGDADDVGFASFLKEICHEFIELVVSDLDAIGVADSFHP